MRDYELSFFCEVLLALPKFEGMKSVWEYITRNDFDQHLAWAWIEDMGQGHASGDHTSLACFDSDQRGRADLKSKAHGIFAGQEIAAAVIQYCAADIQIEWHISDGDRLTPGDLLMTAEGPFTALLSAERTLLNYLQRLSGIASRSAQWTALLEGYPCQLLDTRKTTPGWRGLEKWAVQAGGAGNHRMGLYDYIMIKDNHIDFSGGIAPAVHRCQSYLALHGLALGIEVEARAMKDVEVAVQLEAVDRIMLDNFSVEACREAVKFISGRKETEASGGITETDIVAYAQTGVDFISMGALTHSVQNVDLHFKARQH